ncbi:hypothetical protein DIPPA_04078 [Diplonema papillatum]|nr:hypothetical protein DIPPA_04078 [Diplonema papillatum]
MKNSELMVGFPRIEAVLQEKRLRFAAHCMRSDQPIAGLMFVNQLRARRVGRPLLSFERVICNDLAERDRTRIREWMEDREVWDAKVKEVVANTLKNVEEPPR